METFVGLDVSLGETSVCILDKDGTRIFEGKVASEPAPIARLIRKRAPGVVRVGLESGPTSVWLTHALTAEGLPVVCLDARHAQAVLSVQINKSDRGDARGLAEMIRVGWFKAVQVKSLNAHERKALLIARQQLVDMRVRIDNQLRGILKTFGLVIGKCGRGHALFADTPLSGSSHLHIAASLPPKPMMRRSRIDLGENHDPGKGATDGSTGPLRRCRGQKRYDAGEPDLPQGRHRARHRQ